VYIYTKGYFWLVVWLVGDHLLLRDSGPYVLVFMNVRVMTIAMAMLLRDFAQKR
jgi:hypothetical protein